VFKAIQGHQFR